MSLEERRVLRKHLHQLGNIFSPEDTFYSLYNLGVSLHSQGMISQLDEHGSRPSSCPYTPKLYGFYVLTCRKMKIILRIYNKAVAQFNRQENTRFIMLLNVSVRKQKQCLCQKGVEGNFNYRIFNALWAQRSE